MPGDPGPLVRRRQLGAALRRYREAAGLSAKEAAERLLIAPAKISRIETARRNATLRDVRDLCEAYGIQDEDLRRQLMDLARGSRERGWWQGIGLAPALESLIGMEGSADAIYEFQLVGVPGLLQTREYAAAMLAEFGPADAEAQKFAVDIRMRRHEILEADVPPRVQVVLDEAVLCRLVGGPAVMRDQLAYLARLAGNGRIDVRVLPFGVGAHPGMISGFTVLEFSRPVEPNPGSAMSAVVYTESYAGGDFLDQPSVVQPYLTAFAKARAKALLADVSLDLMKKSARKR